MTNFLKSTTSLGLALALSLPQGAWAQSACAKNIDAQSYPCTAPSGVAVQSRLDALQEREGRQVARIEQLRVSIEQSDRLVTKDKNTNAMRKELSSLQTRLVETRAAIQTARADANANQKAAQKAQEQADAEAKADRQRAQAQADAQAQAKADRQRAQAQAQADQQARADRQRAQADAEAKADRQRAEAQAQADKQARAERRQADAQAQAKDEARAAREADRDRKDRKQDKRARKQAAAAAAAEQGNRDRGEVVTEQLTREDVRSSDQEFDTAVTGSGSDAKKDDGGLSKFEKALLLGLGAVAVGQVLKNGDEVVSRSGDRVVVEREGELRVLKNDDALLRQPGNDVRTETFDDGSTRTVVTKPDSSKIVTIRSSDGTVLRRVRVTPEGEELTLFDDTREEREIVVSQLPQVETTNRQAGLSGEAELRRALLAEQSARQGEAFSLRQVRDITEVRSLAPQIELDAVRFATGSAAIAPEQARSLARIGNTLRDLILDDPRTVLLVEGHTDAVGDATYNLALSDRRAETVALALTEYFDVPAENIIVQGYGESNLKVQSLKSEQANRRAVVRNITGLLR